MSATANTATSGAGASSTSSALESASPILTAPSSTAPNQGPEPQSQPILQTSRKYTCNLCTLTFTSNQEQRDHMRSKWHVHNLQRKVDGLPSVDEEEYLNSLQQPQQRNREFNSPGVQTYTFRRNKGKKQLAESISSSSSEIEVEIDRLAISGEDESSYYEEEDESEELEEEEEDDEDEEEDDTNQPRPSSTVDFKGNKELHLPSGKIIGTKESRRAEKSQARRKILPPHESEINPDAEDPSPSQPSSSQADQQPQTESSLISSSNPHAPNLQKEKPRQTQIISARSTAGLLGLSESTRTALIKQEKQMVMLQNRRRDGFDAGVEARGNVQKHYRIGGSRGGKKMGGLEKRLG